MTCCDCIGTRAVPDIFGDLEACPSCVVASPDGSSWVVLDDTTCLSTGLRDLDRVTGGGRSGDLWTVSGAAGVGKTALALGLARAAALRADLSVAWLSTQQQPQELDSRFLVAEARLTREQLEADNLTDTEDDRLARARDLIANSDCTFSSADPASIVSAATGLAERGDAGMLVLDEVPISNQIPVLQLLRGLATDTGTWIVGVMPDAGLGRRAAHQEVASGADIAVWLDRVDLHEPEHPRRGEADVSVLRVGHRMKEFTVAFQGHFSRLVEMRT